jgi:N-carbamoylputrescine amidase
MARKKRIIRVGLIKAVPVKWDLAGNWRCFEQLAREAVLRGAQIVCTPECFLDGYVAADKERFTKARLRKISQPPRGQGYVRKARDLAGELGIHLVFGFAELARSGSYNSAALIDDAGKLLGCYRKTHLLDHDRRYLPGRRLDVWKTKLGRIGIMICADRRWPETARTLKLRGAEMIMNPTYGMWHLDNEWWMRTRSYENELYICFAHPQVSLVTGPRGELAAKLQSNVPEVLVHDVDLADRPDVMFPARRPEIYQP